MTITFLYRAIYLFSLFFFASSSIASGSLQSLYQKVMQLDSKNSEISLKLNSLPKKDQEIISQFAFDENIKSPFIVEVPGGVYIANPSKVDGVLWWKRIKILFIKQKDWENFLSNPHTIFNSKSFNFDNLKNILD